MDDVFGKFIGHPVPTPWPGEIFVVSNRCADTSFQRHDSSLKQRPRGVQLDTMLTERQEEILDYIVGYQREHGIPPSSRIIKRHFNFASHTSALKHLRALAEKGAVRQLADGSWGAKAKEIQGLMELAILGAIPAGRPDEREQENVETVAVDPKAFGIQTARHSQLWALRVTGDSMINAHICDGDIGVFEQREPHSGEIIAALVDDTTTTLKRLVQLPGGAAILRAENPSYPDITPKDNLVCQGVLVGVIRRVAAVE